jgi:methionyl-tRNA formyltransferase
VTEAYDILFILSYHKIIEPIILDKNRRNIVVHASDLPQGKGWAPLSWQILEGRQEITFSMFEAAAGVDSGDIYLQRLLKLTGYELNVELRSKQAELTIEMCADIVDNVNLLQRGRKQTGEASLYRKRVPEDSRLDITKSIEQQFNLLRIASNEDYPAFFEIDSHRYILKIEEVKN